MRLDTPQAKCVVWTEEMVIEISGIMLTGPSQTSDWKDGSCSDNGPLEGDEEFYVKQ